ncbi:MAG: hypothetical protein ACR2NN_08025 [Bryobacteraceae bacterium]
MCKNFGRPDFGEAKVIVLAIEGRADLLFIHERRGRRAVTATGYRWTALLFLAVTAWFLVNTLLTRPGPAGAGLLLIAAGIPVYFVWRRPAGAPTSLARR